MKVEIYRLAQTVVAFPDVALSCRRVRSDTGYATVCAVQHTICALAEHIRL